VNLLVKVVKLSYEVNLAIMASNRKGLNMFVVCHHNSTLPNVITSSNQISSILIILFTIQEVYNNNNNNNNNNLALETSYADRGFHDFPQTLQTNKCASNYAMAASQHVLSNSLSISSVHGM
jgi:hypothetical protein